MKHRCFLNINMAVAPRLLSAVCAVFNPTLVAHLFAQSLGYLTVGCRAVGVFNGGSVQLLRLFRGVEERSRLKGLYTYIQSHPASSEVLRDTVLTITSKKSGFFLSFRATLSLVSFVNFEYPYYDFF